MITVEMVRGPAGTLHDSYCGDVRVLWDGLTTWGVHTREAGNTWTPHYSKLASEADAIALALKVAKRRYR